MLSSDLFDSSPDDEYLLPDKVLVPTAEADAEDDRPYRDGELGDEYDEEIDDEYILVILLLNEFHKLFVICYSVIIFFNLQQSFDTFYTKRLWD